MTRRCMNWLVALTLATLLFDYPTGAREASGGGAGPARGAKEAAAALPEGGEAKREPRGRVLKYEQYVRLVTRSGLATQKGPPRSALKGVVAKKVTRPAMASPETRHDAPATPVVPAAPAVRLAGWRPGFDEVLVILRTSRNLAGANLSGMNLSGLDLKGVSFAGADLYLANLERTILDGANFRDAALEMANLGCASLRGAKFAGAGLFKADLRGADLEGADLQNVYAVGANLQGAALAGATLRGGVFTNALVDRQERTGATAANVTHGPLAECRVVPAGAPAGEQRETRSMLQF